MSRLIRIVFFGLVLPVLVTSLMFAIAGSLDEALPLISDMLAEGADRAELFAILMEEAGGLTLQTLIFLTVIAGPALAVTGTLALLVTRRAGVLIATGTVAGFLWAATVDYYDSFFTGPGVEWDWPLGGALYGLIVTTLAVFLLRRAKVL